MSVSVILAHPEKGSFNHALAAAAVAVLKKHRKAVNFHDLYAEKFDPLVCPGEYLRGAKLPENIQRHCDEISQSDGIVIVHPNWWGQPPAILKGWVDRVLRPGVAYEFLDGDNGEGVPRGLLRAKAAVVLNTSNTDLRRETSVFGDPLETLWKNCIFGLCGITRVHRKMFGVVVTSNPAQRESWIREAEEMVLQILVNE